MVSFKAANDVDLPILGHKTPISDLEFSNSDDSNLIMVNIRAVPYV